MNVTGIVFRQLCVMALLIGIGYLLARTGVIDHRGGGQLSGILTSCVIPAVIINAFLSLEASADSLRLLALAFVLFFASMGLAILVGTLLFRGPDKSRRAVSRLAIAFTNNGFFGIPVLDAIFGAQGVLFASVCVMVSNVLTWSWGVAQFGGKKKGAARDILRQPTIIALFAGLGLFLFRLWPAGSALATAGWAQPLLYAAGRVLGYLKEMNTPLAMMVLGINVFFAKWKFDRRFFSTFLYVGVRQVALPLVHLGLLALLPIDRTLAFSVFVEAACPCALMVNVMALRYHAPADEQDKSARIVVVSTLCALLTVPLLVWVGSLVLPV